MNAPIKVGDMVRHNDGTIGRVVEVLEALQPAGWLAEYFGPKAEQVVEWRTVASGHRTSSALALTVIDESKLRWRAEVVR